MSALGWLLGAIDSFIRSIWNDMTVRTGVWVLVLFAWEIGRHLEKIRNHLAEIEERLAPEDPFADVPEPS